MNLLISQNEGKTLRIEIRLAGCCGDYIYKVRIVDRLSGKLYVHFDACGDSEFSALAEAKEITRDIIAKNPEA